MTETRTAVLGSAAREGRALTLLALPLVGNNLANVAMQTVDTVMAGQISAADLAAIAIGGAVWMVLLIFGIGIMMAISPLVSHAFGGGRHTDIGGYVHQGFWVASGIGLAIFLLSRSAEPLLVAIGIDAGLMPLTLGYLDALSWSGPGTFYYFLLRFTSEGVGRTRPVLVVAVIGMLLNVPANYLLMYGGFGIPALGAVGCGLATTLVHYAMFFAMLAYVALSRSFTPFAIVRRPEAPRRRAQWEILRLGFPIGVSIFMEVALFGATALLMGSLGTRVAAAHQIAINYASVMFMVPLGLSFAITVRVGQALGAGDPHRARLAGIVGIFMSGLAMLVSAFFMYVLATQIASLYSADAEVVALAASLLGMAAIFQFSDGIQVAVAGALRGFKDTKIPMWITVLAYWGIGAPSAWYLGIHRDLGPHMVWAGLIVGLTVAAVLLSLRLWRVSHRKHWPGPDAPELAFAGKRAREEAVHAETTKAAE